MKKPFRAQSIKSKLVSLLLQKLAAKLIRALTKMRKTSWPTSSVKQ